ncbi:MAG: HEAT repeat domain-containing protein [Planctomycetota bacterium]
MAQLRQTSRLISTLGLSLLSVGLLLPITGCTGRSGYPIVGRIVDIAVTPSPREAVLDAYNTFDPDRRREAIDLLAAAPFGGDEQYLKTYRLILDDPDPLVTAACLRALGRHGDTSDGPAILRRLGDDSPMVRWAAADALQRIHLPHTAVQPLIQAVNDDESVDVRRSAAVALGQYEQPVVFDTLVGVLNDANFSVSQAAYQSLVFLTGQAELPVDSRPWIAWASDNRGRLFAGGAAYVYRDYPDLPTFFDWLQFWKDDAPPVFGTPVGLDAGDAG